MQNEGAFQSILRSWLVWKKRSNAGVSVQSTDDSIHGVQRRGDALLLTLRLVLCTINKLLTLDDSRHDRQVMPEAGVNRSVVYSGADLQTNAYKHLVHQAPTGATCTPRSKTSVTSTKIVTRLEVDDSLRWRMHNVLRKKHSKCQNRENWV